MATEPRRDPDLEWLDHVQPVGLVVAPMLLRELGLTPSRPTQADTAVVGALVGDDPANPAMQNAWPIFEQVLGWDPRHVAGSPGGPALPDDLLVRLPEHDTTLGPTWAVEELEKGGRRWQLLVRIEPAGIDPDARNSADGWEATPHQRFERLLRETGILAGLLVSERNDPRDGEDRWLPELRLVYAPRGETSGHLTFPLRALATVAGRPMLGGLKLLLDAFRLFADASDRRLPALLRKSREAQAAVSTALAEQVLGALHELLRGLDAAEPALVRELARTRPGHLYEGLLTVLMRLVFVLYAEDRDLLPSRTDGRTRQIYETSYAVRGLYARLVEDAALNPDTMDERRGGWGRLLALFRLVYKGHGSGFVQARGGKLFDPDQFPFLEGRDSSEQAATRPSSPSSLVGEGRGWGSVPRVLPVSDGCVLRVLEGLMTLQAKGGARERLSYRTLDVEQIGSVYETVMGFTVESVGGRALAIKAGKNNRTPVYVDLEKLAAAKGKDRIRHLKEADRGQLSTGVAKAMETAKSVAELAAALDPIVDERASPKKHAAAAGTPILQPTDERRRTGSHYTPRSLTEPIVRHALEPAFERLGPDATPEQILDLKVCDPAMGSGAFLVEACRALAARLVAGWSRYPDKKPVIPPDEDEDLQARRLVAQRCLYGVDKNPLATDLARLSLWLATLARDHEFTFLDHALKSGDSLVGLTQAQIAAVHWDTSKPGLPLFRKLVQQRVDEAMTGRAEIRAAPDDTARSVLERKHQFVEERIAFARTIGDDAIAAFFAEDKPKAREMRRAEVESWLIGSLEAEWDKLVAMAAALKQGARPLTPFHWEIEFPEVFARENGGFDAIVGNPPFLGGTLISGRLCRNYLAYLKTSYPGYGDRADLVSIFFRRSHWLVRQGGAFGLIATNTIAQGDTRQSGLCWVLKNSGQIFRAVRRLPWPGDAAVVVSVVHVGKETSWPALLDDKKLSRISAYLVEGTLDDDPHRLSSNTNSCFEGFVPYGAGFLFCDETDGAHPLALMQKLTNEGKVGDGILWPFIGGEELNEEPTQRHRRYAIYFGQDSVSAARRRSQSLVDLLESSVKPERDSKSARVSSAPWWQFLWPRPNLFRKLRATSHYLALSKVSKHHAVAQLGSVVMPSNRLAVVVPGSWSRLSLLQFRAHEIWSRKFGSTLEDRPVYTSRDCFETFPFSMDFEASATLEIAARAYHDYRAAIMAARNEGMTKTYNRFHDPTEIAEDIQRLRELHGAMDRAVLEAYGWDDLAARAAPIFLDETNEDDHTYQGRLFWPSDFRDEVLARLLALNAERHAEEVRLGIAPGMKRKGDDGGEEEELDES